MSEKPSLDPAVFARLSRLQISAEEASRYAKEFERLFEYFNQIATVDTSGVEPMVYPLDPAHRLRDDQISAPPGREILRNAPSVEGGEFFRVPKVIEP
jgi:aspartyl-tRNA(Asn)/glutamyl-tRNA(Gln) amidotransferase subunit C